MSGIFGIISSQRTSEIETSLTRLCKWNSAFGDMRKTEPVSDLFGIGICADHITNAPVNQTPVLHKGKMVAVIDAIIYNREEISASYGISLALSDEEMLFELITKSGPDYLQYVNGDFSGAIYDKEAGKLTLFTDNMGVHPVFYYKSEGLLAFSTEIRGLINLPQVSVDINPEFLYAAVCGYITSTPDRTEYSDIFVLKPATYLDITIEGNSLIYELHHYWNLGSKKIHLSSDKKYIEKMREMITESVRKRLAVFPGVVGAELSGGIDSGVIDILINRLGRQAIYYSWSFDPKDVPLVEQDERLVIQDICDQENIVCNYRNQDYAASNSNIIKKHLELGFDEDAPGSFNVKYAYPLFTNTEIICEASQLVSDKGGKVIFSGHGGDEGVSHRCDPYELYFYGEKLHFIKCLWEYNKDEKKRFMKTFRDYRYKAARGNSYNNDPSVRKSGAAPFILNQEFKDSYRDYKGTPYFFTHDPLRYIKTGATNIRLNVAAMFGPYSGARYVFPFLDKDVIDFAVSIPRHLYINNCQKRYIYRQAFKDIMPQSLYEVTNKRSPSKENHDEVNADWFTDASRLLGDLYNMLDKEMWAKYLDLDHISKMADYTEPGPEGEQGYMAAIDQISEILQFQNIIEKVKAL